MAWFFEPLPKGSPWIQGCHLGVKICDMLGSDLYWWQGAISYATARPSVAASAGALTLAGSPSIRDFVAKSVLSRFTCFWVYHFQPFMVMNGYFMIMTLVQGF